jgi:hypothetical protein
MMAFFSSDWFDAIFLSLLVGFLNWGADRNDGKFHFQYVHLAFNFGIGFCIGRHLL